MTRRELQDLSTRLAHDALAGEPGARALYEVIELVLIERLRLETRGRLGCQPPNRPSPRREAKKCRDQNTGMTCR
jgi:hypothetical protein